MMDMILLWVFIVLAIALVPSVLAMWLEPRIRAFAANRPKLKTRVDWFYELNKDYIEFVVKVLFYSIILPTLVLLFGPIELFRWLQHRPAINRGARELEQLFKDGLIDRASVWAYNLYGESSEAEVPWEVEGIYEGVSYCYSPAEIDWEGTNEGPVPRVVLRALGEFPTEVILRTIKRMKVSRPAGLMVKAKITGLKKGMTASVGEIIRLTPVTPSAQNA